MASTAANGRVFLTIHLPTYDVYIDAPIIRGLGKYDWIGIGLSLLKDQVGIMEFSNQQINGAASYHLAFNAKRNTVITLGIQGGQLSRKIGNKGELKFADGYDNNLVYQTNMSLDHNDINDNSDPSEFDIGAGLMLTQKLNDKMDFNLGAGLFHLLSPRMYHY